MSSKLMLVGAASALLVTFACGCAAESEGDEGAAPADEKTATEQSAIADPNYRDNGGGGYENPRGAWDRRTGDNQGEYRGNYRRNPPGYNPPGYNAYAPGYNPPGYNPPGRGPGYGAGYGRRYNAPGYNPPGYNPYAPGYNPPGYNPPGYGAPGPY
jgi:hypothetical protein